VEPHYTVPRRTHLSCEGTVLKAVAKKSIFFATQRFSTISTSVLGEIVCPVSLKERRINE